MAICQLTQEKKTTLLSSDPSLAALCTQEARLPALTQEDNVYVCFFSCPVFILRQSLVVFTLADMENLPFWQPRL